MKALNSIGAILLTVLVCGVICGEAEGLTVGDINDIYIWIDPDGNVLYTDKIERQGDVYTFIDDINTNGIMVMKSGITIDGDGHTLGGPNNGTGPQYERGGFHLDSVSSVTIKYVTIEDFNNGIYLRASSGNTIRGNTIRDNKRGVFLWESNGSSFYHNNFIDNDTQVYDINDFTLDPLIKQSINVWDANYPSGGNYWSDYYLTRDVNNGSGQDIVGHDGIFDEPHTIDSSNVDRYPATYTYELSVHNIDQGLDYYTIQEAIDEANPGDTIRVEGYPVWPDLNYDLDVNFVDFAAFADSWSRYPFCDLEWFSWHFLWLCRCTLLNDWCDGGDLDRDGKITFRDLAFFAEHWLGRSPVVRSYYENVDVVVPVQIVADGPWSPIIDGIRTTSLGPGSQDHAVEVAANYSRLEGFTLKNAGSGKAGLYFGGWQYNHIIGNKITDMGSGILLEYGSGYNTIAENYVSVDGNGVSIRDSNCVLVVGNRLSSNGGAGVLVEDSNSAKVVSNRIILNEGGVRITGESSNGDVRGNVISSNSSYGVRVDAPNDANTMIASNELEHNFIGVYLLNTYGNSITDNNVIDTNNIGVLAMESPGNTFENNRVKLGANAGIGLYSSGQCKITGNDISDNITGLYVTGSVDCNVASNRIVGHSAVGLEMKNSDCNIVGNILTNNSIGVQLIGSGYLLRRNVLIDNDTGIDVNDSDNTFYHNIFSNSINAVASPGLSNTWDAGYPFDGTDPCDCDCIYGGNFWGDYYEADSNHGPAQNEPNADYPHHADFGIGDVNYYVNSEDDPCNVDEYPIILSTYEITLPSDWPKMKDEYEIVVKVTNITGDFWPQDVNFGGLDQTQAEPGSLGVYFPGINWPKPSWDLGNDRESDTFDPVAIPPYEPDNNETFTMQFSNEWNWIERNDWKDVVKEVVIAGLSKKFKKFAAGLSVADFMHQCYKNSMAVPTMKYTFEPNKSPLVVFAADVTVMVQYYKQSALLGSFVAEVDALALEIAAVVCAVIPGGQAAAAALEAASMVLTGVSVTAYYVAQDPDPNIGEIAELADVNLPEGLESLEEGNAKRFGIAALELGLLEKAFAESCIRYDYAKTADVNGEPNEAGMALQLGAAVRYNAMALLKVREVELLAGITLDEVGMPNPNDTDISDVWNDINDNGLGQSQKDILAMLDINEPNGPDEPYRPSIADVESLILAATDPCDPNIEPLRELYRDAQDTISKYSHSLVQLHYAMGYGLSEEADDQNLVDVIEFQYANDVSITNVWPSSGRVSVGGTVSINVTVENRGSSIAVFDVNAFGGDIPIGTSSGVNLVPGEKRTLEFMWDTTSEAVGYYRIRTEAVYGEDSFTADNSYKGRTICIFDPFAAP